MDENTEAVGDVQETPPPFAFLDETTLVDGVLTMTKRDGDRLLREANAAGRQSLLKYQEEMGIPDEDRAYHSRNHDLSSVWVTS